MVKKIFEKFKINKLQLDNRLIMSAMSTQMAKNGFITPKIIKFYRSRTINSTGLVIIGGASVHPSGNFGMFEIEIFDDKYIPGLIELTSMIHKNNTKAALQLNHAGKLAHPLFIKQTPISSSSLSVEANSVRSKSSPVPITMTLDQIDLIKNSFITSAVRAKKAGFDAVEIHAGNGFLIDQFLSQAVNKRDDQYGGKLINRCRFLLEIIEGIKLKLGNDYPVIIKLNGHDLLENGNTINEHIEIAKILEKSGIDAIELAPGSYESKINNIIMYIPRGNHYYIAKLIKEHINIPVIISERFGFHENINECIVNEYADAVSIARSLICDPLMIEKMKENKINDIKVCISCNQGCYEPLLEMKDSTCIQNPDIFENQKDMPIIKKPKKIVIIGAGPSGLEAAIKLKKYGFNITVFEKNDIICSKIKYASMIPGQSDFLSIINNYTNQLKKYEIPIYFNWNEDINSIIKEKPEALIIATGSKPLLPDIEGINHAIIAENLLNNNISLGKNVVIIGAGALGCETALYSIKKGAMTHEQFYFNLRNGILTLEDALKASLKNNRHVTLLGNKKVIGADLPRSRKITLLEELNECGVKIQTNCRVEKIIKKDTNRYSIKCQIKNKNENNEYIYENHIFDADTVINAIGYASFDDMYEKTKNISPDIYKIGDAKKVGSLKEAIKDGFDIANYLYNKYQ